MSEIHYQISESLTIVTIEAYMKLHVGIINCLPSICHYNRRFGDILTIKNLPWLSRTTFKTINTQNIFHSLLRTYLFENKQN